jgi:predicted nuclease of predicted toxin-antitoxin system
MIIIDENVEQFWIDAIRTKNYKVVSISELHPQISDTSVVDIVKQHKGILITEDKDFGELVFAHGIAGLTIVFLRYDQPQYELIEQRVFDVLAEYLDKKDFYFITITKNRTRIRKI